MVRHAPSIGLGLGLSLRGYGGGMVGLLDLYPATAAYSAYDLGNKRGAVTEAEGTVVNPVQRWRRGSDDALQMFTAAEVASGTALDWAKRPGDFTNDPVNGFDTLTNNSSGDGFYAELLSGVGVAKSSPVVGVVTDVVTVEFEIDIVSGSPSLSLRLNDQVKSNVEVVTTSGSKSIVLTATASFNNFSFGEGDNPAEYTVSNIRFSTATAYLLTEYDQSGNDYDLTQTNAANQPLVVSGGALTVDGAASYSALFDGVDDDLDFTSAFTGLTAANVYAITDNAGTVTLDTLTAQNITAVTTLDGLLASLTYDHVTFVAIYPDATDQAAIQAKILTQFSVT